jgi:transcriptional regulator with XRE-family HTH domain
MTVGASTEAGHRVAAARRSSGMSQKELAEALGVSLWTVDRLEADARDLSRHLPRLAHATGYDEAWFEPSLQPPPAPLPRRTHDVSRGVWLVLGALATLIVVRFFTEVVPVLPKAATFLDVPLAAILVLAAVTMKSAIRTAQQPFLALGSLFFALAVISTFANVSRVAPAPVLVFLYGFLAPLAVYFAVFRLWPGGRALMLSRFLVALGALQLLVVAVVDLPRFLASGNPDEVSGTFGENPYQLVFFLLVVTALLAGVVVFEPRRRTARLAPLMFVGIAGTIFLAQYRALLVTTIATVLLVGVVLASARGKGMLVAALLVAAFVASLSYVGSHFPTTKFRQTVAALQADPWYFVRARAGSLGDVGALYSENPRYVLTGTGPGTFSSRAWRIFANLQETRTAVAAPYAGRLTGGEYHTDVADEYTVPRLQRAPVIQGSRALTSPLSSYTSLLAEVGVLGAVLLIGLYAAALVHAARLMRAAIRARVPSDPLSALLLACTVAFFVLLQLAVLENWLEVTRLTFLSWALLAVSAREIAARSEGAAQ